MDIGRIVAKRRKELRLSQEQLAEKTEISQTHVSSIECGRDNPSLDLLERIANALDCELFIDLIPKGSAAAYVAQEIETEPIERKEIAPPVTSLPNWVTFENARALTIFGLAYQKLEIEKDTLTTAERKALEGIIDTCREMLCQEA